MQWGGATNAGFQRPTYSTTPNQTTPICKNRYNHDTPFTPLPDQHITTIETPHAHEQINPDKDVYCTGGGEPPRNCPDMNHVHNANYTGCICIDGFYSLVNQTVCMRCPIGYFCTGGTATPCPQHQFQPEPGATHCTPCANTADEHGVFSECGEGYQLQWCFEGSKSRICIPCSQCARPYTTAMNGQTKCYRNA